jgi:hypothetical protein
LHATFSSLLLSPASLLSLSPCLGCLSLPCLGPRTVDVGSGRGHVEGNGTSGLDQIGLHSICSVVPNPVLLQAQVGCHDPRVHILRCPYALEKHKMTRLVRQSVYHHSRGHRSILGPGNVHTSNICGRHSGSICSSVPCVYLSPLSSQCSRGGWVAET